MRTFLSVVLVLFAVLAAAEASDAMRDAQQKLKRMGFYQGSVDGQYGSQTAAAIRRYQLAENLQVTGELNAQTMASLGLGGRTTAPRRGASTPVPEYVAIAQIFKGGPYISAPTELQIAAIKQAQKTLKMLGYYGGPINGSPTTSLVNALKQWQQSAGFRQTGRFDETTLKGLDIMPN